MKQEGRYHLFLGVPGFRRQAPSWACPGTLHVKAKGASMRALYAAVLVLTGSAILLVGCSQSSPPTNPTSVPSSIEAASTSASIGAPSTLSPLAVSAAAARQVPFKGTFQGSDT